MSGINAYDIKLMESQRLDDTDQGGGQMTSNPVEDAAINNLFPDISRLDRVYGRVSIRTGFASVQTNGRQTYGGAHVIMTRQTLDPNVSVCFFSTKDWFSVRSTQQQRIESFLVKGPQTQMSLWGNHWKGTSVLAFVSHLDFPAPEVGDVIVLDDTSNEQYLRVIDVTTEIKTFFYMSGSNHVTYEKQVIYVTVGTTLAYDFAGKEVDVVLNFTSDPTKVYETVVADASRYYGVTTLQEPAVEGTLQFRVEDIQTHLVPSAASETSINDYTVGNSVTPMVAMDVDTSTISRSVAYKIISAGRLFLGQGLFPGSFTWTGGTAMHDDGMGNIKDSNEDIIGSIHYENGTITFGASIPYNLTGTGTATYRPSAPLTSVSETGAIDIEINNRGFVYNFFCDPIPEKGSLKIEYLANGKWYTIWDQGNGRISGLNNNTDVGSGTLNFETGTVSMTLAAMPDVGSKIILYWAKPSRYIDVQPETYDLRYKFNLTHEGITRNTFRFVWVGDASGNGPDGSRCVLDDGLGNLVEGTYDGVNWVPVAVPVVFGVLKYTTGLIDLTIPSALAQTGITPSTIFNLEYNYGDKNEYVVEMPPRNVNTGDPLRPDGTITLNLSNDINFSAILPGTFEIEWHTDLVEFDPETRIDWTRDPIFTYRDDGANKFLDDEDDGTTNWVHGSVDYATGVVTFMPDRTSVFPFPTYKWVDTAWLHPGVEQTRVFDKIEFYAAATLFPTDGNVVCKYCTNDGVNNHSYSSAITPTYVIAPNNDMQLLPGSVTLRYGTTHLIDGGDGKLYYQINGQTGDRVHAGNINYTMRTFQIIAENVQLWNIQLLFATAVTNIEPTMSLVFRAPGAPIRAGSFTVRGVTQTGTQLIATGDFSGDIVGEGVLGHVNYNTGLAHVAFGKWVLDDATAQAGEWYFGAPKDGAGNVWKPYIVQAYTVLITCVVTSYLPLDADLIGLDPVRLPMDGKVPIFRDGYIVALQHSQQTTLDTDLAGDVWPSPLVSSRVENASRIAVEAIDVFEVPTTYDIENGELISPKTMTEMVFVQDVGYVQKFEIDLSAGTVTFLSGFVPPVDSQGNRRNIVIRDTYEDLCLASDVQITGHISVTQPLSHTYPAEETTVSSVLPIGDMQSRAYNEFEQGSWTNVWSDVNLNAPPIASFNFVDYPITVFNASCTKERWLIQFTTSSNVRVVGQHLGVLAENLNVITYGGLVSWDGISTGLFLFQGIECLVCGNRMFPGSPFWVIQLAGFGLGWASGNCIRFNTDAANFPVTFVRTTLQAPATEDPNDYYTVQVRGDYS